MSNTIWVACQVLIISEYWPVVDSADDYMMQSSGSINACFARRNDLISRLSNCELIILPLPLNPFGEGHGHVDPVVMGRQPALVGGGW